MGNPEQLAILVGGNNSKNESGVGYKEASHPLKTQSDELVPVSDFVNPTVSEIKELGQEHEELLFASEMAHQKLQPNKAWLMEFTDYIVMLKIILEKIAPKFSVEETIFSVNGQFKGNFESLKEKTINITEGNVYNNFNSIFTELLSLLKHTGVDLQGDLYVNLINTKLAFNREARFFKKEQGMNDADVICKSNHVFKVLRLLRNYLIEGLETESTLQPWITDFFIDEILDWRNSDSVLKKLELKVTAFKIKLKDELSWRLSASTDTRDPFLINKMMIAGIPTIENPYKEKIAPALQYYSSNATLANKTMFPGLEIFKN